MTYRTLLWYILLDPLKLKVNVDNLIFGKSTSACFRFRENAQSNRMFSLNNS